MLGCLGFTFVAFLSKFRQVEVLLMQMPSLDWKNILQGFLDGFECCELYFPFPGHPPNHSDIFLFGC